MEPGRLGQQFAGEPVPSLQQFRDWLATEPGVTAFVEIKPETAGQSDPSDMVARVLVLLDSVRSQVCVISFSSELLAAVRQQDARFRVGLVVESWQDSINAVAAHTDFLFCDLDGLPEQGPLQIPDVCTVVYEVSDWRTALSLAARGIEYVESFDVARLFTEQQDLLEVPA